MHYSLWRGESEIGRIYTDRTARDPALIQGLLRLTSARADLQSVQQMRFRRGEAVLVVESSLPAIGSRLTSARDLRNDTSPPTTPEPPVGLPADRILTVRDEHGAILATDTIILKRLPDSFAQLEPGREQVTEAVVSVWYDGAQRGEE